MNKNTTHITSVSQRALHFLASMPFAIFILCILALVSILGTVIAQNRDTDFYRASYGDFWQKILASLDIQDMYHSWWYLTLLGFLLLSLVLAVVRHGPWIWKAYKRNVTPPPLPSIWEGSIKIERYYPRSLSYDFRDSELCQTLKEQGFRDWVSTTTDSGDSIYYSRKGRLGKIAFFPVHIGLIVILIGGIISTQLGFRGSINIPEGMSTSEVFIPNGDEFEKVDLPFSVRNDRFKIDFYQMGKPSSFQSELTVLEGEKIVAQKTITVNDPLEVGDYTLYQASFGDAGSPIQMTHTDLSKPEFPQQFIDTEIHKILEDGVGNLITMKEFREHTVINLSQNVTEKIMRDVGPSIDVTTQSPADGTITYRVYLHYPHILSFQRLGGEMVTEELGFSPTNSKMVQLLSAYMKSLFQKSRTQTIDANVRRSAFAEALQTVGIPISEAKQIGPPIAKTAEVLIRHKLPALFAFTGYETKRYTGLQITKDPGTNIVWLGCIMLMLGLMIIYIADYRIWVTQSACDEQHTHYQIYVKTARPNGVGLASLFNGIKESLKSPEYRYSEATS